MPVGCGAGMLPTVTHGVAAQAPAVLPHCVSLVHVPPLFVAALKLQRFGPAMLVCPYFPAIACPGTIGAQSIVVVVVAVVEVLVVVRLVLVVVLVEEVVVLVVVVVLLVVVEVVVGTAVAVVDDAVVVVVVVDDEGVVDDVVDVVVVVDDPDWGHSAVTWPLVSSVICF